MKIKLVLLLLLFVVNLQAQVVNIEKKRKDKKEGLQGKIELSLNLTENTKKIIEGNNVINLQYSKKSHTFLVLNDYTLMKVRTSGIDDEDLINKNFQHVRYNYTLKDSSFATFELIAQRQQNKLKYLNFRGLVGTGFRFRIIENERLSIYIAPLIMYEQEILSDSLLTKTKSIKADLYTAINLKITDNIHFSHVTYYQPALYDLGNSNDFERFSDFRLSSETELSFSIIKNKLEFNIKYQMSYDSRPPIELIDNPLFYTLKNQLVFMF